MQVVFYVECFDRDLIVELCNETDIPKAKDIMENAYYKWIEYLDDAEGTCCEEYICECLTNNGIIFVWLNKEE